MIQEKKIYDKIFIQDNVFWCNALSSVIEYAASLFTCPYEKDSMKNSYKSCMINFMKIFVTNSATRLGTLTLIMN